MKYQPLLAIVALLFVSGSGACNPAKTGDPVDIEWENVQHVDGTQAMGLMHQLTRKLDYWHEGQEDTLRLRYVEPGVIVDQDANILEVTPEEWKGMVLLVHQGIRAGQEQAPDEDLDSAVFRSPPAEYFDDGLGNVNRFVYHFRIDPPTTLHVEVDHRLSQRYR